jgi:hypothetical protein
MPNALSPRSVEVVDLDRDGALDIVVGNLGTPALTFRNDGQGAFVPDDDVVLGDRPSRITTGDFNGDGKPDVVSANQNSADLTVALNTSVVGDVSFAAAVSTSGVAGTQSITTGHFDSDGNLDVAVGDISALKIFLGNGDGSFRTGADPGCTSTCVKVTALDANADGNTDLVLLGNDTDVYLGHGDGTFTRVSSPDVDTPSLGDVFVADLNEDGFLDLVVNFSQTFRLQILAGNGQGRFENAPFQHLNGAFCGGRCSGGAVTVADVNDDGRPDGLTTWPGIGRLSTILGLAP